MNLETAPWDTAEFLETPEDCAAYVQAAIDEAGEDISSIVKALGTVARARGMTAVARDAGISREGLYKAIGEIGNPSFATVVRLIHALGLSIHVTVDEPAAA